MTSLFVVSIINTTTTISLQPLMHAKPFTKEIQQDSNQHKKTFGLVLFNYLL